jgi:hypothetical protein
MSLDIRDKLIKVGESKGYILRDIETGFSCLYFMFSLTVPPHSQPRAKHKQKEQYLQCCSIILKTYLNLYLIIFVTSNQIHQNNTRNSSKLHNINL